MRPVDPHGLAVRMTKTLTWVRDAPSMWAGIGHDPWASSSPENRRGRLPPAACPAKVTPRPGHGEKGCRAPLPR